MMITCSDPPCPFRIPTLYYSGAGVIKGTGFRCAHPDFDSSESKTRDFVDNGCNRHPAAMEQQEFVTTEINKVIETCDHLLLAQDVYRRLWEKVEGLVINLFQVELTDRVLEQYKHNFNHLIKMMDDTREEMPPEGRNYLPKVHETLRELVK